MAFGLRRLIELVKGGVPRDSFHHSINIASGTRYQDVADPINVSPIASLGTAVTEIVIPKNSGDLLLVLEPFGDDLRFSTNRQLTGLKISGNGFGFVQDGKAKGIPVANRRSIFVRADDGTVTNLYFYFETTEDPGEK